MTEAKVREAIALLDTAMKTTGQTREMMSSPRIVEALQVVGCDVGARPKDAPMFDDVKSHIIAVRREPTRLTVEFAAVAAEQVAAFVAAEQVCCSDLAFSLIPGDPTIMQINATPELVDAVEGWMTPTS